MIARRLRPAALLLVLVAAAAPSAAPAQVPAPAAAAGVNPCGPPTDPPAALNATTTRIGVVDLKLDDTPRPGVTFYECLGSRAIRLGVRASPDGGITVFGGAARWLCGRTTRTFAAETTLPDGTLSRGRSVIPTPSCEKRFTLAAPRRIATGQAVRVRVADGWLTGAVTVRLCLVDPAGRRDCETIGLPAGRTAVTRTLRPRRAGRWALDLQVGAFHVRQPVAVGVRPLPGTRRPVVLATGDSTIHGVDSALLREFRGQAKVVGDMHPGFAMSLANSWLPIARAQLAQHHPTAVLVSMGAAEGFPMKGRDGLTHVCCDAPWIAEYARRVRQVMTIYLRGGRTAVFYETIFASRQPARQRIVEAVNQAILQAAAATPAVTVLRADRLFSPNGYQETLRWKGRTVAIRKPDGVHLSAAGSAIEAEVAADAIRARLPAAFP